MAASRKNNAAGAPLTAILGMNSGTGADSERTGFDTAGYIDKQGTPHGESAMFNHMPPGMDITNQAMTEQYAMPMKKLTGLSYPGDGGFADKDIPE